MVAPDLTPSPDQDVPCVPSDLPNGDCRTKHSGTISCAPTRTANLELLAGKARKNQILPQNRERFVTYWKSARKTFGLSDQGMMLNGLATTSDFVDAEREEILSWLVAALKPGALCESTTSISENVCPEAFLVDRLIEIGAGIGRMTPFLQPLCREIVAVDFIEEYIDTNRKRNFNPEYRANDEFLCRDATLLRYEEGHFDVVFWNWLLMYLGDDEVKAFLKEAAKWVKVGGFIFCRESCGEPSTKESRTWAPAGNPTNYRSYPFYTWLLTEYLQEHGFKVEVVFKEAIVSIYKTTGTDGQRCWLIKRLE